MPIVKLRVSRASGEVVRSSERDVKERGERETIGYEPFEKPLLNTNLRVSADPG